jgi:hypothetical protein
MIEHQPNRQVYEAGRLLTDVAATLTTAALAHIANVINGNGELKATVMDDGSRSSDNTSTTERAALNAVDDGLDEAGRQAARAHEQWTMRNKREDIRDARHAMTTIIRDYIALCQTVLPKDDKLKVKLCDGRGFEGSHIPWIPGSRDERNGWHDATCVDAADGSGLCNRCRIREYRWRVRNGLTPREANSPGAEAA